MRLKTLATFAFVDILIGCGEKEPVKPMFKAPDALQLGLGKVYEGYLNVLRGLAEENPLSNNTLSIIHGSIHEITTEGLDSAAKAYWDSGSVPEVRNAIMDITPILIDRMEKYGVKTQYPVYLIHCPKAKGNQGADWLQNYRAVITNPYLGNTERTCGTLVREIATLR